MLSEISKAPEKPEGFESFEKSEHELPVDEEVLSQAPNKDLVILFSLIMNKVKHSFFNIHFCSGGIYH